MAHSISFFKDEVRNGFYIPTAIKQGWAANLDVLSVIDRICEENDIKYFADWGTFLGAVRHGGFVPWDDDLDICMLRDDYTKFRSVADSLLPEGYVIHDYERKENHRLFLSRVVNNSKMCFDMEYLDGHNNFPWLAGVDIFVKDYLYIDDKKEQRRDKEIMNILVIADGIMDGKLNRQSVSAHIGEIKRKYHVSFPGLYREHDVAVALYRLAEKLMSEVKPWQAETVGQIFPWVLKYGSSQSERKEFYESLIRLPFEDTTIPVPAAYNTVLALRYGNYNEIHKVWTGHDYPFFEGQKEEMERLSGELFPGFSFDDSMLTRKAVDRSRSLKETSRECLKELGLLLEDAVNILHGGTMEELTQTISDAQQLAAEFGTLVEEVKGADRKCTVNVTESLQSYCDALYQEYQEIADGVDKEDMPLSRVALKNVSESVEENIIKRKEILFLPIGAKEWNAFEETYLEYVGRDDTDVYIVPLPLMRKSFLGTISMSAEGIEAAVGIEAYPKDIPYTDWKTYDFGLHCPDAVYIQNPYDGVNPLLTVPPDYYARNMQPYTDRIVYIPIAKTSEFGSEDINDQYNLKHYAAAPGVVYADEVILQSENIKKQYIGALTAFAGADTKSIWEEKIHFKAVSGESDADKREKRILYCLGANELTEKKDVFALSVKERMKTFCGNDDSLCVHISLYPNDRRQWEIVDKKLADTVFGEVDMALSGTEYEVVSIKVSEADEAASYYDAYYGSPSPYVPAFVVLGKPVMIANYKV